MGFHSALLCERLAANVTGERFFAGMYSRVIRQRASVVEFLGTEAALEMADSTSCFWCFVNSLVLRQLVTAVKPLPTYIACELDLVEVVQK